MYYTSLSFLRNETYGDNKVTHKDLAKYIGVSLGTYRHYESENAIFPIKHLNKVCEFYNVSLDYVFRFTITMNYPNNSYKIDGEKSRKRIKLLRTNLGLTMKDFGEILGCTASNINDYESGRTIISTKKLYILCKEFNISADYLLGKIDEPIREIKEKNKKRKIIWNEDADDEVYLHPYNKMLKLLRNEKNLTRSEVAKILSLETNTYGQYESGNIIIPIKHLDTLSEYYETSIDSILGLKGKRKYDNSRCIDNILSGKRIKELRKLLGYNQEKLAKVLNVPRSTIAGYEAGRYIIPTDLLCKLCEKFNVSADYILGKIDENKKDNQ